MTAQPLPQSQATILGIPDASLRSPDENAAAARNHSMSGMMVLLAKGVECSAKIAMTALRAWRYATGLLPDLDQAQRIFLMWGAMHIFPSLAFKLHDVAIEAAMER